MEKQDAGIQQPLYHRLFQYALLGNPLTVRIRQLGQIRRKNGPFLLLGAGHRIRRTQRYIRLPGFTGKIISHAAQRFRLQPHNFLCNKSGRQQSAVIIGMGCIHKIIRSDLRPHIAQSPEAACMQIDYRHMQLSPYSEAA